MAEGYQSALPGTFRGFFLDGCDITSCSLHGNSKPIRPRGSWDAKAWWLGEGPGKVEQEENCTFVGPAGKLAVDSLEEVGIPLDKNFVAPNSVFCRPLPPAGSRKQNRTPTAGQRPRPNFVRTELE